MARLFSILLLLACLPFLRAQTSDDELANLAKALRPLILNAMPNPLYEKSENWGNKNMAPNQLKWKGLRPRIIKVPKNDGTWKKTRVKAVNPHGTLEFHLSNLQAVGQDKHTFRAFLALVVQIEHEQEIWESGVRLFRDTIEARVRIKATLDVETTMRLENNPKSFLPDTVFRLRVTRADVSYDNLEVMRIAGIGGTGARWLGEAIRSSLKQWKPSIERELMAKANTAIVKAADTREVRLSLTSLFSKK